jgi:Flp pilus assembly protein TadB
MPNLPPAADHRVGNPFRTIFTALVGVALLVTGFVFSLVILSVVAMLALTIGAWFWWNTRALRRHLGEQLQRQQQRRTEDSQAREGVTIEGEVIREHRDTGAQ